MLRIRSSGVAKHSQHTLGKAMDIYIPGVSLSRLRETGMKKQRGGVVFILHQAHHLCILMLVMCAHGRA